MEINESTLNEIITICKDLQNQGVEFTQHYNLNHKINPTPTHDINYEHFIIFDIKGEVLERRWVEIGGLSGEETVKKINKIIEEWKLEENLVNADIYWNFG